jgi:hypothetical protein
MRPAASHSQSSPGARPDAGQLFAVASVLAALLFGLAALLGSIGYLISVIRRREKAGFSLS